MYGNIGDVRKKFEESESVEKPWEAEQSQYGKVSHVQPSQIGSPSDTGVGEKDDEEGNEEPVYVSLSQMQARFEAQTAKTDAAAQERFPPRTS